MKHSRYHALLTYLTSHRMAFSGMLLFMAGLLLRLVFSQQAWLSDGPLVLLLACLALSLLYRRRRFIARPSMLLFHLSLLVTLGAILLSPWFRASGYFELAEGQTLHDKLIFFKSGRFAGRPPVDWTLTQKNIHAEYRYGSIGKTIHTSLLDHKQQRTVSIGFMQATRVDGYRIEPTGNMGYAAIFTYTDRQGRASRGVVNFPGYPTQTIQVKAFKTPAGKWAKASLKMDDWPYHAKQAWTLDIPATVRIKLKTEHTRFILKPGEVHKLPSGTLRLDKVSRWLGYKLSRDPMAPWIFISTLLGCLSLIFYWLQARKFEIIAWNRVFFTAG